MTATVAPIKSRGTVTTNGAARRAAPPSLQDAWLGEQLRRRVTVRLSDSKTLAGVLMGYDAYSLTLQVEQGKPPTLVYKQHVAYIRPEGKPVD